MKEELGEKWEGRDVALWHRGKTLAWLKILTFDRIGVVHRISDVLVSHDVNQRFGYFTAFDKNGKYVSLVELPPNVDVVELVNELKKVDDVLDVEYEVREGFCFQNNEFPLYILGERAVIFRAEMISELFGMISASFPQAEGFMNLCGMKSGVRVAQIVEGMIEVEPSKRLKLLEEIVPFVGWGRCEVVFESNGSEGKDRESFSLAIITHDSFLTSSIESHHPVCVYLGGFYTGYVSYVLGRRVYARETMCMAKGDPYC
ncbi:hypothetical protein DRN72_00055 [Methanosarcinales archaeon]|nr:MAG: hypothetical protein DRN72_00055 [Methanosarcinales archaeon]